MNKNLADITEKNNEYNKNLERKEKDKFSNEKLTGINFKFKRNNFDFIR